MSQIELPNSLTVITDQINFYKQQAGQALFEIGARLKHVKEYDLVHGQWESWLESIDIPKTTAWNMIHAYEQFSKVPTSERLPTGKIFEMLSLPETIDRQDFIEKPHTIPSTGEVKTVDEMTVKELREVKRALKDAESRAEAAERNASHWEKVAKSTPVRVETKPVEVVPSDYEDLKKQAAIAQKLNVENVQLQRALSQQREEYELKLTQEDKRKAVTKDLKKFCQELLQQHGMYTEAIIYNVSLNLGDRDTAQIIEAFQIQYSHDVQVFLSKIKQMTTVRTVS